MNSTMHDDKMKKYAELIVRVGLNLQKDQRLMIRGPLESAPLVRAVSASAYEEGCPLVDVYYADEQLNKIRLQHAPHGSFEEYAGWQEQAVHEHLKNGGAILSILGEDPNLLKDQDPKLIAITRKIANQHMKPVRKLLSGGFSNWAIVSYPVSVWATEVFPDIPEEGAVAKLWSEIYKVCRLDLQDPIAAWRDHINDLIGRCKFLEEKQYNSLRFYGGGTDLTIGLVEGHIWQGGRSYTRAGLEFTPNLPTEEIFTIPHRGRVDGIVRFTKPRSYSGNLIEDFSLTFNAGRVQDVKAAKGQTILEDLIATDEGAARMGEVALVSHNSPISQSGVLFYNALFDENAASHIALGNAYRMCLLGGEALSDEEFNQRGGNTSLVHVDLMIGSQEMDIDGIKKNGTIEPVMRAGEWAFEVPAG